jgi:uncharacterized membrane protein YheB (UPF0754 family)
MVSYNIKGLKVKIHCVYTKGKEGENKMEFLKYVIPIIIGAVIGYCTNYIAIKMLFRPKKAVKIGNCTLPFTPGIIPKNQKRLAKAVGNAVGEKLFTSEDLQKAFVSEKMKKTVSTALVDGIMTEKTVGQVLIDNLGNERYEQTSEQLCEKTYAMVEEFIQEIDITSIIVDIGKTTILEQVQGTMLAMFLNESVIASIAEPMGEGIRKYIQENGREKILPFIEQKVESLSLRTPEELLNLVEVHPDTIEKLFEELYENMVTEKLGVILEEINVAAIVEEKMNQMDVDEIENLVMSVMKHELQAVINLGAVIGAVIGAVNLLFF